MIPDDASRVVGIMLHCYAVAAFNHAYNNQTNGA